MKQIYVIRHGDSSQNHSGLTNRSKQSCFSLKYRLPTFNLIISSRDPSCKLTAKMLTEKSPKIDKRAGISKKSRIQGRFKLTHRHFSPRGGAGQLYTIPYIISLNEKAGSNLFKLIEDTLNKLPENGKALIISHNQNMVATVNFLQGKTTAKIGNQFNEMEGFSVNQNLKVEKFQ